MLKHQPLDTLCMGVLDLKSSYLLMLFANVACKAMVNSTESGDHIVRG